MADNIKLVTYAGQTAQPVDDGVVYEAAIGGGGILFGCDSSILNDNTVHINGGHGVLCGRKFTIYDCSITCPLSPQGVIDGRIKIHMDLANSAEPISIVIQTGNDIDTLEQDEDANIHAGIYEIALCTFKVSEVRITNLVNVFEILSPVRIAIRDNTNAINSLTTLANTLRLSVESAQSSISTISQNLTILTDRVTTIQQAYAGSISDLDARIIVLTDRVAVTETSIQSINNTISSLQSTVEQHTTQIQNLQNGTNTAQYANRLSTARKFKISDGTNNGTEVNFDGSANATLRLPNRIKATYFDGEAKTAAKLTTARNIGNASFDGSGNLSLNDIGAAALESNGKVKADQLSSATVTVSSSITLSSSHKGKLMRCNNSSNITLTIPNISDGAEIEIVRWGAGEVTLSCESTFRCPDGSITSVRIGPRYSTVILKQIGSDWLLGGAYTV